MSLLFKIFCSDKEKFTFLSNIVLSSPDSFLFKQFYYFDSLLSTQDYAHQLLEKDSGISPSVILSDVQTGGKGRRGTNWVSPLGGIWMSIVLNSGIKLQELFIVVALTAFIICKTIEEETNLKPAIKWPNDIIVKGKKVAGILLDTELEGDKIKHVILGIGINSNNDLDSTILNIQDVIAQTYKITTLKHENNNIKISNTSFIYRFLGMMSEFFPRRKSNVFRNQLTLFYRNKIKESMKDLEYRFYTDGKKFSGEIVKINDDGSLLVKDLDKILNKGLIKINSVFDLDFN